MQPHMATADLCRAFGVGGAPWRPRTRVDLLERNPLVWMFEVNGFLVDMRSAPRELQEAAFEQGLIPYIPDGADAELEEPVCAPTPEQQPPGDLPLFAKAGK